MVILPFQGAVEASVQENTYMREVRFSSLCYFRCRKGTSECPRTTFLFLLRRHSAGNAYTADVVALSSIPFSFLKPFFILWRKCSHFILLYMFNSYLVLLSFRFETNQLAQILQWEVLPIVRSSTLFFGIWAIKSSIYIIFLAISYYQIKYCIELCTVNFLKTFQNYVPISCMFMYRLMYTMVVLYFVQHNSIGIVKLNLLFIEFSVTLIKFKTRTIIIFIKQVQSISQK